MKREQSLGIDGFAADGFFFAAEASRAEGRSTPKSSVTREQAPAANAASKVCVRVECRFEIGIVSDGVFFPGNGVIGHPVDHRFVDAIAGPLLAAAERCQRLTDVFAGSALLNDAVQCEVVAQSPLCPHPIEASFADEGAVRIVNANGGNGGQSMLLKIAGTRAALLNGTAETR